MYEFRPAKLSRDKSLQSNSISHGNSYKYGSNSSNSQRNSHNSKHFNVIQGNSTRKKVILGLICPLVRRQYYNWTYVWTADILRWKRLCWKWKSGSSQNRILLHVHLSIPKPFKNKACNSNLQFNCTIYTTIPESHHK